jgi:DNA-binding NarL/FixJ family response regulator
MATSAGRPLDPPEWLRASAARVKRLTQAQLGVLGCLAQGMDIRDTARALNRSERTVKAHTTEIMIKFCVDSRLKAGIIGYHLTMAGELDVPGLEVPERAMPESPSSAT